MVCVGSACVGTMFEFGAKKGGGGLEKSISATYFGAGFRVDLVGGFEFPGSRFGVDEAEFPFVIVVDGS